MHDMLYEHQETLNAADLHRFAEEIGLDVARFDEDMAEDRYRDRVREDFMSGVRSGVNGTPTFFINGVRYDGRWTEVYLTRALEQAAQASE
jgi:predicted DsbA family dithiol-disulfide isomerase